MKSYRTAVLLSLCLAACSSPVPNPAAPRTDAGDPPVTATSYPTSGPAVVAYVAAKHPERLVAGISIEQRTANMEFLRDRVIETGICGGLNLAWNLKRGVGPRSIDAIDWRHGADDVNDVVDLAYDWDNTDRPLSLHWQIIDGPAGWDPFPKPVCR